MKRDRPPGKSASHPGWEDTRPMSRFDAPTRRPGEVEVARASARRLTSLLDREIEGLEVSVLDSPSVFDQLFGDPSRT